jgi:hypothetical protein
MGLKERPILMSGELVRASLADLKTQTRRPVKDQNECKVFEFGHDWERKEVLGRCKYGRVGDILWVRETYTIDERGATDNDPGYYYRADMLDKDIWQGYWKPSIFMPKEACRLKLEILDIRIERLQDISEEDAKAEGVEKGRVLGFGAIGIETYREGFFAKWMEIYGVESLMDNPWVWVLKYKKIEK